VFGCLDAGRYRHPTGPVGCQSRYLSQLLEGTFLNDDERDVLRWARNAKLQNFPKRFKSARSEEVVEGSDPRLVYRDASCLEALVGFLYVTTPDRLQQLMDFLGLGNESGLPSTGQRSEGDT